MSIDIPCPTCSGTADHSTDDGHRDNKKDACVTCGGTKTIPAATGTLQTAAFNPKTGQPYTYAETNATKVRTVKVSVVKMECSNGADYYVEIACDGRTITPHKFKERWKAEYEVAEYSYTFGLRESPPDIMSYDEKAYPNDEPELCVDEGCPHHGTPHVCNVTVASDVPDYLSDLELQELFSMGEDEELKPNEHGQIHTHDGYWMMHTSGWYFVKHPDVE